MPGFTINTKSMTNRTGVLTRCWRGRSDAHRLVHGRLMQGLEVREIAVELCARAMKLAPGSGEVRTIAAEVLSKGLPKWHVDIVRDTGRNNAYEAALQRAVFPGCKVLEIGTGTGLLAMMAIRAGPASYHPESNRRRPGFARSSSANGFSVAFGYDDDSTILDSIAICTACRPFVSRFSRTICWVKAHPALCTPTTTF